MTEKEGGNLKMNEKSLLADNYLPESKESELNWTLLWFTVFYEEKIILFGKRRAATINDSLKCWEMICLL